MRKVLFTAQGGGHAPHAVTSPPTPQGGAGSDKEMRAGPTAPQKKGRQRVVDGGRAERRPAITRPRGGVTLKRERQDRGGDEAPHPRAGRGAP